MSNCAHILFYHFEYPNSVIFIIQCSSNTRAYILKSCISACFLIVTPCRVLPVGCWVYFSYCWSLPILLLLLLTTIFLLSVKNYLGFNGLPPENKVWWWPLIAEILPFFEREEGASCWPTIPKITHFVALWPKTSISVANWHKHFHFH